MKPNDDVDLKVYLRAYRKAQTEKRMARKAVVRLSLSILLLWFAFVGIVKTIQSLFN